MSYLFVSLFEGSNSPHIHESNDDALEYIKKRYIGFIEDIDPEELLMETPNFALFYETFLIRRIKIDTNQDVYIIQDGNYFIHGGKILTNDLEEWKSSSITKGDMNFLKSCTWSARTRRMLEDE